MDLSLIRHSEPQAKNLSLASSVIPERLYRESMCWMKVAALSFHLNFTHLFLLVFQRRAVYLPHSS